MRFTYTIILLFIVGFANANQNPEPNPEPPIWGFFGHKRINRLAVFTLPPELIVFYKKNIEYITDHAVDPDKRRYAIKQEAPRHFIDLDRYGNDFETLLPKSWNEALAKFTEIYVVTKQGDTLQLTNREQVVIEKKYITFSSPNIKKLYQKDTIHIDKRKYKSFIFNVIERNVGELNLPLVLDSIKPFLDIKDIKYAFAKEILSEHGIVPWHLQTMQKRLTEAFKLRDFDKILRLSAEIGHYVGDAHVPLHTTQNYNGQLTNQVGIHGFWESRIPELFADTEFDYFVGKADYVENKQQYFWKTVMDSHAFVDSVLQIEKRLSVTFPSDQQYCYEDRMNTNVRQPCRAYAQAYNVAMQGQVEARMRAAILSVGSAWYSAWVDAGQPNMSDMALKPTNTKDDENAEKAIENGGTMIGRSEN